MHNTVSSFLDRFGKKKISNLSTLIESGKDAVEKILKPQTTKIVDREREQSEELNKLTKKDARRVEQKRIREQKEKIQKAREERQQAEHETAKEGSQLRTENLRKTIKTISACNDVSELKKLDNPDNPSQALYNVNPAYSAARRVGDTDYTQNCGWCTYAYELRRRGYDVVAGGDNNGISNLTVRNCYTKKDGSRLELTDVQSLNLTGFYNSNDPNSGFSKAKKKYEDALAKYEQDKKEYDALPIYKKIFTEEPSNSEVRSAEKEYSSYAQENAYGIKWDDSTSSDTIYAIGSDDGGGVVSYTRADGTKGYRQKKTINYKKVAADMEKAMVAEGNGTRGQVSVSWEVGGGHLMAYEVVNGKVVIYDSQTHTTRTLEGVLAYARDAGYFRTDDKEITNEILKYVRNNPEDE